MAIFSNQATLTVGGVTTSSNIAYGEILEALTTAKVALESTYAPGDSVTYVVTLRNTGTAPITDLTLTDDLGAYTVGTATTVYPLTVNADNVAVFVGGVRQDTPVVNAGPPMTITGISVPSGTDAVVVYQARVNDFANPNQGGTIVNTVTLSGGGLTAPITATATVDAAQTPNLSISKSISPTQVVDNDRVTYTFVIRNTGNQAVALTDNAVISDTFDPALSDLTVTFDGDPWTLGTQYTYTGNQFNTQPGYLEVPAATYTQDPVTGAYTITPGIATLVVTGTI